MDRTDTLTIERTITNLTTAVQATSYRGICPDCGPLPDTWTTAAFAAIDAEQHLLGHLEYRLAEAGLIASAAAR